MATYARGVFVPSARASAFLYRLWAYPLSTTTPLILVHPPDLAQCSASLSWLRTCSAGHNTDELVEDGLYGRVKGYSDLLIKSIRVYGPAEGEGEGSNGPVSPLGAEHNDSTFDLIDWSPPPGHLHSHFQGRARRCKQSVGLEEL